jgi:hypothetical protein
MSDDICYGIIGMIGAGITGLVRSKPVVLDCSCGRAGRTGALGHTTVGFLITTAPLQAFARSL